MSMRAAGYLGIVVVCVFMWLAPGGCLRGSGSELSEAVAALGVAERQLAEQQELLSTMSPAAELDEAFRELSAVLADAPDVDENRRPVGFSLFGGELIECAGGFRAVPTGEDGQAFGAADFVGIPDTERVWWSTNLIVYEMVGPDARADLMRDVNDWSALVKAVDDVSAASGGRRAPDDGQMLLALAEWVSARDALKSALTARLESDLSDAQTRLSEAAAAGDDTSAIESQIASLERWLADAVEASMPHIPSALQDDTAVRAAHETVNAAAENLHAPMLAFMDDVVAEDWRLLHELCVMHQNRKPHVSLESLVISADLSAIGDEARTRVAAIFTYWSCSDVCTQRR